MAAEKSDEIRSGRIEPISVEKVMRRIGAAGVALIDVRCAKCQRLLFKGAMRGEIKCPRCAHMNRWS